MNWKWRFHFRFIAFALLLISWWGAHAPSNTSCRFLPNCGGIPIDAGLIRLHPCSSTRPTWSGSPPTANDAALRRQSRRNEADEAPTTPPHQLPVRRLSERRRGQVGMAPGHRGGPPSRRRVLVLSHHQASEQRHGGNPHVCREMCLSTFCIIFESLFFNGHCVGMQVIRYMAIAQRF